MKKSDKPIVYYVGTPQFYKWIDGKTEVANLQYVFNHPKLGSLMNVRTSKVLRKRDNGFETSNTIYVHGGKEHYDMFEEFCKTRFGQAPEYDHKTIPDLLEGNNH